MQRCPKCTPQPARGLCLFDQKLRKNGEKLRNFEKKTRKDPSGQAQLAEHFLKAGLAAQEAKQGGDFEVLRRNAQGYP